MKRYVWLIIVALGIALTAYSVYIEESKLVLAVIIPLVMVSGVYGTVGIALIILGMVVDVLIFFSSGGMVYEMDEREEPAKKEEKPQARPAKKGEGPPVGKSMSSNKGAILFIGPIPIVFGSDRRVAKVLLILGVVLFVVVFVGFFLMYFLL